MGRARLSVGARDGKRCEHFGRVFQDRAVVEADDAVAFALKPFSAVIVVPFIVFVPVLAAVSFDDERRFEAEEVDVV